MAYETLVPPGERFEFNCPKGTKPIVLPGYQFPESGEANAFVVDVQESKIIIGPLKAGTFELGTLCSGDPELTRVILSIEVPDPSKVEATPPLAPLPIAFPTWVLWGFLGLLVMGGALGFLGWKFYRSKNRRKKSKKIITPKTPSEELLSFLQQAPTFNQSPDLVLQTQIYSGGIVCLRAYLEEHLLFSAPGATSKEFVGEFKAAALKSGRLKKDQVAQIESLFLQATQVIYAGEIPDSQVRTAFIKQLQQVYSVLGPSLPPSTSSPEKGKSK